MKRGSWKRWLACLVAVIMLCSMLPLAASASDTVVIVLDPGHGGSDGGASATHDGVSVNERDLTWKIAGYCKEYLEANYGNVKVILTRTQTSNPSLSARVQTAVDNGADYFLSIHLNATESGTARGALAIVPRGKYRPEQAEASKAVATAIKDNLVALGLADQGFMTTLSDSATYPDGSTADGFAVVRYCVRNNIPGIIMEQCFIDNYKDYTNFLSTDAKLKSLGVANAQGLASALGLTKTSSGSGESGSSDSYTISHTDVTLSVGESFSLKLKDSSGTTAGVTWTVNNSAVATVSGNTVTGVGAGTTKVWVTMNDVTYSCIVRVQGSGSASGDTSSGTETSTLPFTDVSSGEWFYDDVVYVYENGLMNGTSGTTFAPYEAVSRAMVVTLLHRMAGTPAAASTGTFTDVGSGAWYSEAVEWAYAKGITTGVSAKEFAPEQTVTREEFVTFLYRYAILAGVDTTNSQSLSAFSDGGSVSEYAKDALRWAVANSILTGFDDGTIRPQDSLERGQLAALVSRFHQGLDGGTVEEPETYTISHTDVTITVGESYYLKLKNSAGETVSVTWTASKSGYVTISGNKITGAAAGTVTVSCTVDGQTYKCIVRVKSS